MLKTIKAAMAAFIAAGAVVLATPAAAQGTTGPVNATRDGGCPSGYSRGNPDITAMARKGQTNRTTCYPDLSSNGPSVYQRASRNAACAQGYRVDSGSADFCTTAAAPRAWSAENNLAKQTRLTKPSPSARCPTGWASAKDLKTCYTTLDNPPAARLSNGKPCAAGEMAEWGLWCTGSIAGVTYAQADGHGTKDFNEVYLYLQMNGGNYEAMKCCLSPAAEAYYKANGKGPQSAAASRDGPGDYTSAEEDEARGMAVARGMVPGAAGQPAQGQCTSGSAAGAAIGGAFGGEAGARIGSMLGGFGKKKNKPAGC